jgi:rhamnosyltransferase
MVTVGPRQREGDGTSYPEDNRSGLFSVSILACGSPSLQTLLEGGEGLAWIHANPGSTPNQALPMDLVGFTRMTVSSSGSSPRVGAVVVLYQPESDVLENLRILAAQVDALVIVDNGSSESFRELLGPMLNARVGLIRHTENLGIASGFNTGVRRLIELGCEFVFTFDQDSGIPAGFAHGMVNSMLEAEQQFGPVGVFLPDWCDAKLGFVSSVSVGHDLLEVHSGISSGSLYRTKIFSKIGFFADEYFIDGVDTEFCLRCRQNRFKVIQNKAWVVSHNLGQQLEINLLGVCFPIYVHGVFRKYYIARNRILNYKKYAVREQKWFWNDFLIAWRELFHVIAYESTKRERLKNIFLGFRDGIINKTGKFNP